MADTRVKRPRAATKDHVRNFETVMAGLLMPVADAELEDRELVRLEERARRAAKKRAEDAWWIAYMQQQAAKHAYLALDSLRVVAKHHPEIHPEPQADELQALRTRWWKAVDAMMHIPAIKVAHLRWKQDHSKMVNVWGPGWHREGPNKEWAKLIAADEVRLTRK